MLLKNDLRGKKKLNRIYKIKLHTISKCFRFDKYKSNRVQRKLDIEKLKFHQAPIYDEEKAQLDIEKTIN